MIRMKYCCVTLFSQQVTLFRESIRTERIFPSWFFRRLDRGVIFILKCFSSCLGWLFTFPARPVVNKKTLLEDYINVILKMKANRYPMLVTNSPMDLHRNRSRQTCTSISLQVFGLGALFQSTACSLCCVVSEMASASS